MNQIVRRDESQGGCAAEDPWLTGHPPLNLDSPQSPYSEHIDEATQVLNFQGLFPI